MKKLTPALKVGLGPLRRGFGSSGYLEHVLEEGWPLDGHIHLASWTLYSMGRGRAEGRPEQSLGQGPLLPDSENRTLECVLQRATQWVLSQAGNAFEVLSFILRSHTKFLSPQPTLIHSRSSFHLLRPRPL